MKVILANDILEKSRQDDNYRRDLIDLIGKRDVLNIKLYVHEVDRALANDLGVGDFVELVEAYSSKSKRSTSPGKMRGSEPLSENTETYFNLLVDEAADLLISESQDLISRGQYLELTDSVYSLKAFRAYLSTIFESEEQAYPYVERVSVADIDINDPILESLKVDYPGEFEQWWARIGDKQRQAWVVRDGDVIAGLCVYKEVDKDEALKFSELGESPFKICTFKVAESYKGFKIGELILKPVLEKAVEINSSSVFLTVFEDRQPELVNFLSSFGFNIASEKKGNEALMYKQMKPPEDVEAPEPFVFYQLYSPHFLEGEDVKKYAIPIRPGYHAELFPSINPVVVEEKNFTENVPGNTIKKVYLCNSHTTFIPPGSLIFFYRSRDIQSITTLGVVEKCFLFKRVEDVTKVISNRSVFTEEEISDLVKKNKGCVTIVFRLVGHFDKPIHLNDLVRKGVLNAAPVSITELSHEGYFKIKEKSKLLKQFSFKTKLKTD